MILEKMLLPQLKDGPILTRSKKIEVSKEAKIIAAIIEKKMYENGINSHTDGFSARSLGESNSSEYSTSTSALSTILKKSSPVAEVVPSEFESMIPSKSCGDSDRIFVRTDDYDRSGNEILMDHLRALQTVVLESTKRQGQTYQQGKEHKRPSEFLLLSPSNPAKRRKLETTASLSSFSKMEIVRACVDHSTFENLIKVSDKIRQYKRNHYTCNSCKQIQQNSIMPSDVASSDPCPLQSTTLFLKGNEKIPYEVSTLFFRTPDLLSIIDQTSSIRQLQQIQYEKLLRHSLISISIYEGWYHKNRK
jgi:hypothetical protein